MINTWVTSALFLVSVLTIGGLDTLPKQLHDLSRQQTIATNKLLGRMEGHRVIFAGESHYNEVDHVMQLEIIRQLKASGREVVVGLEMFPASLQRALDDWVKGRLSTEGFTALYYTTWKVPYIRYQAIFDYAKENKIRLVGLNIPPKLADLILEKGVESESKRMLSDLKYRNCSQEIKYAKAMHSFWTRFDHTGDFMNTCNVRRFREAFMAMRIQKVLELHGERVVVVLAGAVHTLRNAIPEMIKRRGVDGGSLIMVPRGLRRLTGTEVTVEQSDLVW